jgi:DNA-binding CsgD family transcriptional regulator
MTTDSTITRDELLDRGRVAYSANRWAAAFDDLRAADDVAPLSLDDLERLAVAAHLIGRNDLAVQTGMRAFSVAADAGDLERAARSGFWTGLGFAFHGEAAQAGAWFARANEVLERLAQDVVEAGYLLIPVGLEAQSRKDDAAALATFEQISSIADRFHDADLATIGRLGRGETLIALGERDRGIRLLDEAMAAVTAGEVSPPVAGIIYCATVEACRATFDLRRAREWTAALTAWCAAQPDLVFRGQCLTYRAELMRFNGDWTTAADEAGRAKMVLLGPPVNPAVGEAMYEEAELYRLQGRLRDAEAGYIEASGFGRQPEPGLALLRLAQGRGPAAQRVIARALEESPTDPRLLEAAVTIALGRGDVAGARSHADALLASIGQGSPTLLEAMVESAEGDVLLAEGHEREALRTLRRAFAVWQELDAPFEAARVRVAIGRALRALGDEETAELELAAARRVFEDLGAAPALADLDRLSGTSAHGLSPRELEVLRHLAGGRTNRDIAEELGISERTVDRHVSNLYTKLDVSTRAAATAWAYEHGLA